MIDRKDIIAIYALLLLGGMALIFVSFNTSPPNLIDLGLGALLVVVAALKLRRRRRRRTASAPE